MTVEEKFRQFLTWVCEQLKHSPGSVEIVHTFGTSVLGEQSHHWIEFAVSNMLGIHINARSMIDLVEHFFDYDDEPSQFMCDFTEVMDDFAFHAAVFNLYFFAFDRAMRREVQQTACQSRPARATTADIEGYADNIRAIAQVWELGVDAEEKQSLLTDIVLNLARVIRGFEQVFGDPGESRAFDRYGHLNDLHKAITALQFHWSVIRSPGT